MYRLIANQLIPIKQAANSALEVIDTRHLYIKNLDDHFNIVVNSFKNEALIVPSNCIKDQKMVVAKEIAPYFEYPNYEPDELDDLDEITLDHQYVTVSIALTYSCNLRCSYCFQQKYDQLDRKTIRSDYLDIIFAKIKSLQVQGKIVDIQLFGGEPFLPKNEEAILKIFEFASSHGIFVSAVTNGSFLPYFAKHLVIYRSFISNIMTTVNTTPKNYATITKITKVANNPDKLIRVIKTLVDHGVNMCIATNVDRLNQDELPGLYQVFTDIGLLASDRFNWSIGRVDDRFFDEDYPYLLTESEVLASVMALPSLPDNVKAAFMQTTYNLAQKLALNFRQSQKKGQHHYCWATSPYDQVFYVDNSLDVYRCTVTVGRQALAIGNLEEDEPLECQWSSESYLDFETCRQCVIGGFCSGGCKISRMRDFEKNCQQERSGFERFIETILIPKVKELLDAS